MHRFGSAIGGAIHLPTVTVPDFEALIADEALLDADFGATNRESARRALS